MRGICISFGLAALLVAAPLAEAQTGKPAGKTLDIYVIDVEGGKADALHHADRADGAHRYRQSRPARSRIAIMAVFAAAGVKQIDYLVTTHYHVDHIGGMQELAKRDADRHYIDHGPSVEEREQVAGFQAAYAELKQGRKQHGRQAGRQAADHRHRLADRDVGRPGGQDAAAGRRQAESRTAPTSSRARTCAIPRTDSRSAA